MFRGLLFLQPSEEVYLAALSSIPTFSRAGWPRFSIKGFAIRPLIAQLRHQPEVQPDSTDANGLCFALIHLLLQMGYRLPSFTVLVLLFFTCPPALLNSVCLYFFKFFITA